MTDNIKRGISDAQCMDGEILIQRSCGSSRSTCPLRPTAGGNPVAWNRPSDVQPCLWLGERSAFDSGGGGARGAWPLRGQREVQLYFSRPLKAKTCNVSQSSPPGRQTHIGQPEKRSWCSFTPEADDCSRFNDCSSAGAGPFCPSHSPEDWEA